MIEYFESLELWQQLVIAVLLVLLLVSLVAYLVENVLFAKNKKIKKLKLEVLTTKKRPSGRWVILSYKPKIKKANYVAVNDIKTKYKFNEKNTLEVLLVNDDENIELNFLTASNRIVAKGEFFIAKEVSVKAPSNELKPAEDTQIQEPIEEQVDEVTTEETVEETPIEEVVQEVEEEAEEQVDEIEETPEEVEEAIEDVNEEQAASEEQVEETPNENPVVAVINESNETEEVEDTIEEAEEEVKLVVDETGKKFVVRYKKSFKAKLIQTTDINKDFYTRVKNYILSYKGVKSRLSWNYDSFNKGRNQLAKITLRGKTLTVYLALDPKEYENSKYFFIDSSDVKKYQDVPFRIKVKSERGFKYAQELIDDLMKKFGLEQKEIPTEDYYLPYEETAQLIEEKEIIELYKEATEADLIKFENVEEPKEEVVEEIESAEEDDNDEEQDEEVQIVVDDMGIEYVVRRRKSFMAKFIQSSDTTKEAYSKIKNKLLSYEDVKSRLSWAYDSFNKGRSKLAKISIRGKSLNIYLALDPKEFENTKYNFIDASNVKKYQDTPMRLKVKSERGLKYALELIEQLAEKQNLTLGKESDENFYLPYEETEQLMEEKQIVEVQVPLKK